MTLVNKQLGGIAQAILYKDIEMKWTHRGPHPLGLIVRTLFDRPDLADMVKNLQLDGCIPSRPWTKTPMSLELSAISRFMGNTKDTDYWANEVARGILSAVAAFLVALTPKVREISLTGSLSALAVGFPSYLRGRGLRDFPSMGI